MSGSAFVPYEAKIGASPYELAFAALRSPVALIKANAEVIELLAATRSFRSLLGLDEPQEGALLPLLPESWRGPVASAVRACLEARYSKRIRRLPPIGADGQALELEIYRIGALDGARLLVASLDRLDTATLLSDPRLATLFPHVEADNAAVVYETDILAGRTRYRDNGLVARFGFAPDAFPTQEFLVKVHPEDQPLVEAFWDVRARLRDGEINGLTVRVRAVSGEWRYVTLRARVLSRTPSGAPRRMLGVAVDISRRNAVARALAEADRAIAQASEQERQRIAMDLHDSTGQHLLGVALGLRRLELGVAKDDPMRQTINEIQSAIGAAQREVRMFSFLLHPPELASSDLESALRRFCVGFARRTGLLIDFLPVGSPVDVDMELSVAIYRVVQEALMNVFRHARAARAWVNLTWTGPELIARIEDDGTTTWPLDADNSSAGVGLRSMRQRVHHVGGRLEVRAQATGHAVVVSAPVTHRRD